MKKVKTKQKNGKKIKPSSSPQNKYKELFTVQMDAQLYSEFKNIYKNNTRKTVERLMKPNVDKCVRIGTSMDLKEI